MSLGVMQTLEISEKQVIAKGKCFACNKPVDLKVNKKGGVYYFCPHVSQDGKWCSDHHKWGPHVSDAIMLRAKGAPADKAPPVPENMGEKPKGGEDGFF